jgi:hypothetical protein
LIVDCAACCPFFVTCCPAIGNAATVNDNNRMVAATSTAAAQPTTTTDIATAAISQSCHCLQCHHVIVVINDSGNKAIAITAINCRCHQQCPTLALALTPSYTLARVALARVTLSSCCHH